MTADRNTQYLRLRQINLRSTSWYRDFNYNLQRIDSIGRMLRLPVGAGGSSAIRSYLADGTLAEAIRFVPDGDSINIRFGRIGKSDKIFFDAGLSFQDITLANRVTAFSDYRMSIGATWIDEDAGGDPIQDTQFFINPRNNLKTVVEVPPSYLTGIVDSNWLGSAAQLEADDSGVGTGMHFLKLSVQSTTGTRDFIVPAYLL